MSAPVVHLPAGVFVPVAPCIVTIGVKRNTTTVSFTHLRQSSVRRLGRWAKPHVPIKPLRNVDGRDRRRTGGTADSTSDLADLPDPTRPDQCNGLQESVVIFAIRDSRGALPVAQGTIIGQSQGEATQGTDYEGIS